MRTEPAEASCRSPRCLLRVEADAARVLQPHNSLGGGDSCLCSRDGETEPRDAQRLALSHTASQWHHSKPQIVVIGPPPTFKNLHVVNGTRFV